MKIVITLDSFKVIYYISSDNIFFRQLIYNTHTTTILNNNRYE